MAENYFLAHLWSEIITVYAIVHLNMQSIYMHRDVQLIFVVEYFSLTNFFRMRQVEKP